MNFSLLVVIITEVLLYFVKKYFVRPSRRPSVLIMFLIVTIENLKGNTTVFKESACLKISHGLHVNGVELTSVVPIHFLVPSSFPKCLRQ
jgi:hypothetical protein